MYPEIEGCNCCRDVKIEKDIGWHCDNCLMKYHHYTQTQIEGIYKNMVGKIDEKNRLRTRKERQKLNQNVPIV
jgi:hypothetical protein